jgi:exodeoxyribonuclease V gamma subunit
VLHLVKSNRMERLVRALAEVTASGPQDPFVPEWICIQSRGMKQWISLELAKIRGISARLNFLFPGDLIQHFLEQRHPDRTVLDLDVLLWAVYARLDDHPKAPPLAPLAAYFETDATGRKQMQLARQIAGVLDDYQVYRPDMLLNWENGGSQLHPENPTEVWQSWLWHKIVSMSRAASLPRLMNDLVMSARERTLPNLPHRISLFGLSSVPPSFLSVFSALDTEVFLFLLSPSNQYFFDMVSPGQMDRIALKKENGTGPDPAEDHWEISHPLLASLGRSSRQFQALLETEVYLEPFPDLFVDPVDVAANAGPVTLLSRLQSDILNLTFRQPGREAPPLPVDPKDTSLCVHVCHSPMREAQVLKDLLLETFARDSETAPHDVMVMMPDIEAYAPYIQAVFSREPAIPFSISDRRHKTESPTIEAFLKILDLTGSRLEQSRVMDLLLCPPVAETFDIPPAEIRELTGMIQRSGIFWGMDADHRQALTGKAFKENTWLFGFERLFMGMAMPVGTEFLVNQVLPCPFAEGTDAGILGRFAHFCHTLFSHLNTLSGRHTPEQWERRFTALIQEMITLTPAREPDVRFLFQVCQDLTRAADTAGFAGTIGFPAARDLVMSKLDQTVSRGGFMTGGVTFCNLVPMRSIPFKVVALMGMDETAFPRKVFPRSFDLMTKNSRPGDKNLREEDRTLFLETLLSARNRLIITYTGMDIRDNSSLPCSGVVSELADVVNAGVTFPSGYQWWVTHRLHPFDPAYFDGTPVLFSYSDEQCQIARSRAGQSRTASGTSGPDAVSSGTGTGPSGKATEAPVRAAGISSAGTGVPPEQETGVSETISLASLGRFFTRPLTVFYQTCPELVFPELEDPLPDREPFQVTGLDRYALGSWIMEKEMPESGYLLARAGGRLPLGNQGRLAWQDLLHAARPIQALARKWEPDTPCEPVSMDLDLAGSRIQGTVGDLYDLNGTMVRCVTDFGRIHARRLIRNWILHLAVTLMMPDIPVTTRIIGTDPFRPKAVGMQVFTPVGDAARPCLENLVALYVHGLTHPWPFFPETGLVLARSLAENQYDLEDAAMTRAMKKARPAWFNAHSGKGEKTDRYTAVWLAGQPDPFDTLAHLRTSGIVTHALAVFKPLLAHLETRS